MLGLDDDPSQLVSAERAVVNRGKQTLLLASLFMQGIGPIDPRRHLRLSPTILGQPDEIAHVVSLTPAQDSPAAKAAVAPKDDLHLRPVPPQRLDQQ